MPIFSIYKFFFSAFVGEERKKEKNKIKLTEPTQQKQQDAGAPKTADEKQPGVGNGCLTGSLHTRHTHPNVSRKMISHLCRAQHMPFVYLIYLPILSSAGRCCWYKQERERQRQTGNKTLGNQCRSVTHKKGAEDLSFLFYFFFIDALNARRLDYNQRQRRRQHEKRREMYELS